MLTDGDSDRFEAVDDEDAEDGKETEETPQQTGYGFELPVVDTPPEIPGEQEVSEPTDETAVVDMVVVINLTRDDVQLLVADDNGVETQVRLTRRSTYGPIARSRLTPQVNSLQTNKHVRIESQNN